MNQLTTIQQGWLKLAEIRIDLFDRLRLDELACQAELNNIQELPLERMQANLRNAKFNLSEAKRKRLEFTRMIDDKLTQPSMEFEKRMAAMIDEASKFELAARLDIESKAKESQLHANEVALYKSHIINEWTRIAHEYRSNLQKMIDSSYINCISARVPVNQLDAMILDLQSIMSKFDLSSFVKFQRMFITDQEALDIFHSIDKYEPSNDLAYYQTLVNDRFQMYAHDLANEESLAKLEAEQRIRVAAAEQELAANIATNTLIAQAETLIVDTPKVKREIKIVVIESEAWAMAVMTNFIKNWQYVNKYVKVKSWAKLSIGQMAEALAKHISETGETFSNLTTEEVCK
jgi:hypothetical protein